MYYRIASNNLRLFIKKGINVDYSLTQLEAFVVVVEQGSFKAAALTLNKRAQAVAKLIAALEDACGYLLFDRQVRRIDITAEGKQLYTLAKRIMTDAGRFDMKLASLGAGLPKHFKLAIDTSIACPEITRCYQAIFDEIPMIDLSVLMGGTAQVVEWIKTGEVEMGLVFSPLVEIDGIARQTAFNFNTVEIASSSLLNRGEVVSTEKIADLTQAVQQFIYDFGHEKIHVQSDNVIITNSVPEILRLVSCGMAWARVPQFMAQPFIDTGAVHEFSIEGSTPINWYAELLYSGDESLTLASEIFMDQAMLLNDRLNTA